jgi:hypothetical protein
MVVEGRVEGLGKFGFGRFSSSERNQSDGAHNKNNNGKNKTTSFGGQSTGEAGSLDSSLDRSVHQQN